MEVYEWLIVAFTGVVALSTVVYAFLTWRLVSETRRMRKVQTEPRVSVRVEPDHTGLPGYELVIANEGQGPAINVHFKFTGDSTYFRSSFQGTAPPPIDQLPAIRDGLAYMEAGYILRYTLGTVSAKEFGRAAQHPWKFDVKYKNLTSGEKEDTYVVDFSQYKGAIFAKNRLKEMSKHLESMRKDLHRLAEGHARVQVVTQTREEFEQMRLEWRKTQENDIAKGTEKPIADNSEEY